MPHTDRMAARAAHALDLRLARRERLAAETGWDEESAKN